MIYKEKKLKELETLITELFCSNVLTEEEINIIIDKSIEKYKVYRNKLLYKKIMEEKK